MLRRLLTLAALAWALDLGAAEWHSGKPLTNAFPLPGEVAAQVYTVAQGEGGALYLGGTMGLQRFDGVRWQRVHVPGRLVRSLHLDGERLWVGGYGAFGYLERDATGSERFVDVAPRFAAQMAGREVADIWMIHARPEAIYFRGLNDLFAVGRDGAPRGHWHHRGRFGSIATWQGKLLAQFRGEGLKVLEGGRFVPLARSEELSNSLVYAFYPLAEDRLMVHLPGGHKLWTPEGLQELPWKGAPPHAELQTPGVLMGDGRIAFGGSDGIVRVMDLERSQETEIPVSASRVTRPVVDAVDGALWVADAQGLYRISWPTRWHRFDQEAGLRGNVYRVREMAGRVFAATGGGLFEARLNERGELSRFERRDWAVGESWDVVAEGANLLIADSLSLKQVSNGRVGLVSGRDLYPRVFVPSRIVPGRIWVGLEHGVARVERTPGGWKAAARYPYSRTLVQSIVELEGGRELLLGTVNGVVRLSLKDAALQDHAFTPLALGAAPAAGMALVSRVGDSIHASSAKGVFTWEGGRFVPAERGFEALRGFGVPFEITLGADGTLWASSSRAALRRTAGGDRWESLAINPFRRGLLSPITVTEQGTAYAGDAGSLFRFTPIPDGGRAPARSPLLRVSGIEIRSPDGTAQRMPLGERLRLPASAESITLELAFDDYARFDAPQFQARLLGHERRFGEATDRPVFTYGRLAPGTYRFEALARDGAGREHRYGPVDLEVAPRWHEMAWVRLLGIAGVLLLLAALVTALARWRTRRLDALVAVRTRELEAANAKLEDLATRDGLTGVRNRCHFDDMLARIVAERARESRRLALLMADVDHFKRFNDTRGHMAGDELLKRVGAILHAAASEMGGHAARYGGEEFALLLPGASREQALAAAERIRSEVAAIPDGVTISIGLAHGNVHPDAAARMVAAADEALYRAKGAGRNQVVVARHQAREQEPRAAAAD